MVQLMQGSKSLPTSLRVVLNVPYTIPEEDNDIDSYLGSDVEFCEFSGRSIFCTTSTLHGFAQLIYYLDHLRKFKVYLESLVTHNNGLL